jgi:signal transduction histidine kinase
MFDVVEKAFNLVSHVAQKKNVKLISPELLNQSEFKYYNAIYGDKHRFLQVIVNFLSNSLKFSS